MITDVIRNTETEQEIFVLISAYVGDTRYIEKSPCLAECASALPLQDGAEIRLRLGQLMYELDRASRNLDDDACLILREAVHVFGTALDRLNTLRHLQRTALAA